MAHTVACAAYATNCIKVKQTMNSTNVKSKQQGIKVKHNGSPAFNIFFGRTVNSMPEKDAGFLKKNHADMFIIGKAKKTVEFDLDGDGDFDKDDVSLAGKTLNAAKKLKKKEGK